MRPSRLPKKRPLSEYAVIGRYDGYGGTLALQSLPRLWLAVSAISRLEAAATRHVPGHLRLGYRP